MDIRTMLLCKRRNFFEHTPRVLKSEERRGRGRRADFRYCSIPWIWCFVLNILQSLLSMFGIIAQMTAMVMLLV